jgi:hypothetical protein
MELETLLNLIISLLIALWLVCGLVPFLLHGLLPVKLPPIWTIFIGPFCILWIYLAAKYKDKVNPNTLTEDERYIQNLRKMTAENSPESAYTATGRIRSTAYPELEKEILQRASEGYYHWFIMDNNSQDNKIIATSVKSYKDLSINGFSKRSQAESSGLNYLNSLVSDWESHYHEETPPEYTVRTVAAGPT